MKYYVKHHKHNEYYCFSQIMGNYFTTKDKALHLCVFDTKEQAQQSIKDDLTPISSILVVTTELK